MKLYEIADDIRALLGNLDDETGEVSEDQAKALDELGMAFNQKAEAVAAFIRELEAEQDAFAREGRLFYQKAHRRAARVDWLKQYLLAQMIKLGAKRIDGQMLSVRRQASPPSAKVLDEAAIPKTYFVPQPDKLDGRALLDALKAGLEVPGAELHKGEHIRIA